MSYYIGYEFTKLPNPRCYPVAKHASSTSPGISLGSDRPLNSLISMAFSLRWEVGGGVGEGHWNEATLTLQPHHKVCYN